MARMTVCPVGGMWIENQDVLYELVDTLDTKGHEARLIESSEAWAGLPQPDLVVQLVSEEDGRGLARIGRDVVVALKRSRVGVPERVAFFDHAGRLLTDTAPWLRG